MSSGVFPRVLKFPGQGLSAGTPAEALISYRRHHKEAHFQIARFIYGLTLVPPGVVTTSR